MNKKCTRPDLFGHLYKLKQRVVAYDRVGNIDTHDWWVHILNFSPKRLPSHFEKVCDCVEDRMYDAMRG